MADAEIRGSVSLDLDTLTQQLRLVQQAQSTADARTQAVVRRVRTAEIEVQRLDRTADRLFSKVKSLSKNVVRGAIGIGAAALVDPLDLSDDPFTQAVGGVLQSASVGFLFGGAAGALTAGLGSAGAQALNAATREIKRLIEENEKRAKEVAQQVRNDLDRLRGDVYELGRTLEERAEKLEKDVEKELKKLEEDTEELDYQTSQYVE